MVEDDRRFDRRWSKMIEDDRGWMGEATGRVTIVVEGAWGEGALEGARTP